MTTMFLFNVVGRGAWEPHAAIMSLSMRFSSNSSGFKMVGTCLAYGVLHAFIDLDRLVRSMAKRDEAPRIINAQTHSVVT